MGVNRKIGMICPVELFYRVEGLGSLPLFLMLEVIFVVCMLVYSKNGESQKSSIETIVSKADYHSFQGGLGHATSSVDPRDKSIHRIANEAPQQDRKMK